MLRSALTLVLAPGAALTLRGLLDVLAMPDCAPQSSTAPCRAAAAGLLVAIVLLVLAWTDWAAGAGQPGKGVEAKVRRRFLSVLAIAVAMVSGLVIVALWLDAWSRSPCNP